MTFLARVLQPLRRMTERKPADDFEVEYHLTPNGWVRGCEWFFGRLQAESPTPVDRLLTLRKRLYQRAPDSVKDTTWTTVWQNPAVSDAEIESLRNRHRWPEAV